MNTNNESITKHPPGLPSLPLSLTETGALATAPLSTVVNSSTDALYQDLYNLVHGDVKIVSVASNAGGAEGDGAAGASGGGGGGSEHHPVEENNNDPANSTAAGGGGGGTDAVLETRKQRMANLSFAQRRHELTHRVVQHTKSLAHVYALTAASLPKSHLSILQQKALKSQNILPVVPKYTIRRRGWVPLWRSQVMHSNL